MTENILISVEMAGNCVVKWFFCDANTGNIGG